MTVTAFRAHRALVTIDGEVVDGPATIVVSDGVVLDVLPSFDATPDQAIDHETVVPEDQILLPGLVDTHVHVNEPGRTEWEGFASATRAAAAGGVTTLIDMPLNSIPSTITMDALRTKQDVAREKVKVNAGFWGGVTPQNLGTGELRELWETGRVFGFKCFLLHSGVDEFPPLTPEQLVEAMEEIAAFNGQIIVHAEDAHLIEEGEKAQEAAGGITEEYSTFEASRPPAAEAAAVKTVIESAEKTGCRAHILHLSDSGSLEQIRAAQQRGVKLTVETCPHYLSLFSEEIQDGGTQNKCCPPVRGAANREQLWRGLFSGEISMIVSDHSPCTAELKKFQDLGFSGSFGEAWGGIASVELGLPVVWSQARLRGKELKDVIHWMSTAPAQWAGLTDRGQITAGSRADFIAVSADDAFVVLPEKLHQKNKVTAYAQRALAGVVNTTYIGGQVVYDRRAAAGGVGQDTEIFPGPQGALVERP